MTSKTDQARKDAVNDAAEAVVNGYLGGVGAHPSLQGLRMVTPSLFGLGVAAAILFDIDEYAKAKNIGEFSVQGVGTAGGIAGAYVGGALGVSVGIYIGPLGAVLGGALGSVVGAYLGEEAFEGAIRDVMGGLDALGDYFSTSSTFDAIQTNRPGQYLSGWKDGAPAYSGTKYSGGINENGTSWGLDSPSERIGPSERSQFTSPQALEGPSGSGPSALPSAMAVSPVFVPISPVTPPSFEHVPVSPVPAPSFPAPQSTTSSRGAGGAGNGSTSGSGFGGGGERGGIGGGYGGTGTSGGRGRATGVSGTSSNSSASGSSGSRGRTSGGRGTTSGSPKAGGNKRGGGKTGGSSPSGGGGKIEGGGIGSDRNADRTGREGGGKTGGSPRGGGGKMGGSIGAPILLDIAGTGLTINPLSSSSQFFDLEGHRFSQRTAWAGDGTGVLVFDADGDGKISQSKEFAFVEWAPSAKSDFEALRQVFDRNGNGKLDADDAQWSRFRLSLGDELVSLDDLGITSIDLTPSGSGQTFADGSAITGTSSYTKSDGTVGRVGDAVLAVDANVYRIDESTATSADKSSVKTIRGYHSSGEIAFINEETVSADGLTRSTKFDDNGDGVFDRSQQITLSVASDGIRTKTVSDLGGDGSLQTRTVTITSADGNTITTTLDKDGDRVADQKQVFARHADGSSTTTTEELTSSGGLVKRVEVSASADGLSKTTRLDPNGAGLYQLVITEQTVVNADGSKTKTESCYSADNTLISRITTAISIDGLAHTLSYDRDGNGVVDAQETTKVVMDAAGNVTTEIKRLNGDGTRSGQAKTKLSPDAQTRLSEVDLTGDGVADLITTETTSTNDTLWKETVESRSSDGTLLSRKITVVDSGKKSKEITTDIDGDGAIDVTETTTTAPIGKITTVTRKKNRNDSVRESSRLSVSVDGLSRSLASDLDGNGKTDLTETDVTVVNADGSRTRTVRKTSRNGSLIGQTVTETSSDGLIIVTRDDVTGDGVADTTTTDGLVSNADGSQTRTVTKVSANGTLLGKTANSLSSDRKTATTVIDDNGDGNPDQRIEETTNTDGTTKKVETSTNVDGSLRSKTTSDVSTDRLTSFVEKDVDGDGVVDFKSVDAKTPSADGSRTTVESQYAGKTLVSQKTTHISGNELTIKTTIDENGDGVIERHVNDSTALKADGSTTRTQSVLTGNDQSLISRTETTTNSNGLNKTISVDQDGDGKTDRITKSVKNLNANGSILETTTITSANGSKIYQSQIDTSADKNTISITTDLDGDGQVDGDCTTAIQPNGSVVETISRFDNETGTHKLTSRSEKTVSDNGFSTRIVHDTDGDGRADYVDLATTVLNDNGDRTETIWRESVSGSIIENTIVKKSANGLSQSIKWQGARGTPGSLEKTKTVLVDGSTVETEKFNKANGTLQSLTEITQSADKLSTTMTRDVDGDGVVDHRSDVRRLADGKRVSTYSDYSADGVTVTDRKTITETANGNFVQVDYDRNGDGQFDTRTEEQVVTSANGDATTTTSRMDSALKLLDQFTVKESADGLTVERRWDFDGNGQDDRRRLDVTTLSNTGSTTRTESEFDAKDVLSSRIERTTSANGLTVTASWDRDGSGDFEQISNDVSVLNADGTTTRTVTNSKNGSLFSKTVSTDSADGTRQTVVEDFHGLGLGSRVSSIRKTVRADGANIEERTVSNNNGSLLEKQITVTSADKRSAETSSDVDGDGKTDQNRTYTQHNDGAQSSVKTGYRDGTIKDYQTKTTVSADGLKITTDWDEDGDGRLDRRREVINQFSIDGSSRSRTTDRSPRGAVLSSATETVSADGLTRDVTRDLNGDGAIDVTETYQTRIDGQVVATIVNNDEGRQAKYLQPGSVYWQASVAAKIERTVSGDGLSWTERSDFDGNGSFEYIVTSQRQIDGSVVSAITELNADGSVKTSGSLVESHDGRTRVLTKDISKDGIVDEIQTSASRLDGSSLWTRQEFSSTGTLTQTTKEKFSALGKLDCRWTEDDFGRKTGEMIINASGGAVYSRYDGATGQLLSETSLDKNGIKINATLYDPLNSESWTKINQSYSSGKLASQNKINDNGTKESIRYNTSNGSVSSLELTDPQNVEAWTSIKQSFSNGVLSSYDKLLDDGAREYFTYNTQTQKVTTQTYYYSNGQIRENNTYDGQSGNLKSRNLYEADGRQKENTEVDPTGGRKTIWQDTANLQSWKSLEQETNVQGQLTRQETIRDDNSREIWFYDPQNTQNWSSVVWQSDSLGRFTGKTINNDDGSRETSVWDRANSQSWDEFIQRFSSNGQLKSQEQSNDDGTKEYWWWDVDNESPSGGAYVGWNHIYEKRDQSGQVIKKAVQWDYGYWTYPVPPVLLDLNGDGALELRVLDQSTFPTVGGTTFDWDGDGIADETAWVGPNDGMLVIDLAKDGSSGPDGRIDQPKEIAFALWKTEDERLAELKEQGIDDTGQPVTDLEGLRFAFDSNRDNVLDMRDERWNEFRVWQDKNQNGVADAGELLTMEQAGIRLIDLMPSKEGAKAFADGSVITGTSQAQMTDGTKMLVGDVTLAYRPSLSA